MSSRGSAAGPPTPLPKYIYKILPHHTVDPRYAFPIPIPAKHQFFVSELDAKDGFLHFSQADQIEGTLTRFFSKVKAVTLLRCDYGRLSGWKIVKWETSGTGGVYPHLYAQLEGENVDSFKELVRQEGSASGEKEDWTAVCDKARAERWLQ